MTGGHCCDVGPMTPMIFEMSLTILELSDMHGIINLILSLCGAISDQLQMLCVLWCLSQIIITPLINKTNIAKRYLHSLWKLRENHPHSLKYIPWKILPCKNASKLALYFLYTMIHIWHDYYIKCVLNLEEIFNGQTKFCLQTIVFAQVLQDAQWSNKTKRISKHLIQSAMFRLTTVFIEQLTNHTLFLM